MIKSLKSRSLEPKKLLLLNKEIKIPRSFRLVTVSVTIVSERSLLTIPNPKKFLILYH